MLKCKYPSLPFIIVLQILIHFGICSTIYTQNTDTDLLLARADSISKQKNYVEANSFYRIVATQTIDVLDLETNYKALVGIYKNSIRLGKTNSAVKELGNYINILPKDSLFDLARIGFLQASLYSKGGHFYKAILKYQELIPVFLRLENTTFLRPCYRNLSTAYSRIGDQKSAVQYLDKAILLVDDEKGKTTYCSYNTSKGIYLFYDDKNLKAEEQYLKVLEECPDYIYAKLYLLELYIQTKNMTRAAELLKSLNSAGSDIPEVHLNLSDYFYENGEISASIESRKEALSLILKNNNRRFYIKEQVRLAQIFQDVGELDSAFYYANSALMLLMQMEGKIQLDTLKSEIIPYEIWAAEAFMIRANYFKELYIQTGKIDDLKLVIHSYDMVFELFDRQQEIFYADQSRYRLGAHVRDFYHQYLSFCFDLYQENPEELIWREKAFMTAQGANSNVLRSSLSEREMFELLGVTQADIAQYYELKEGLQQDKNSPEILQFFLDTLQARYPQLFKLKQSREMSVNEIRMNMTEESLLLKYYYSEEFFMCFAITKDAFEIFRFPIDQSLRKALQQFKDILKGGINQFIPEDERNFIKAGKLIYDILLDEVLKLPNFSEKTELIIVPDGPLRDLSFAALPSGEMKSWLESDQYLLSNYSISYLHFCSQVKNSKKRPGKKRFIGLGIDYTDPYFQKETKEHIMTLPYSSEEVESCSNIYDGHQLLNQAVKYGSVKEALNNYTTVHLAMHHMVDEENHLNSHLLVFPDSSGGKDQFRYSDVLQISNPPDRVILSSCQSAYGKEIKSEGLMSMSRAFIQTGVHSVVSSYWNVPDKITKELMQSFHTLVQDGASPAQALQQVQLDYVGNEEVSPSFRAPPFWAGWVVYGDIQSFQGPDGKVIFILSGLGVILLGLILFKVFKTGF